MGLLRHPKVLPRAAAASAARSFLSCPAPTRGKHFYSSSESEEEEEAHKKFNIKIKPLQAKDILKSAATVDELKASVGNIALSPSPVVSAPCLVFCFFVCFFFPGLWKQGCLVCFSPGSLFLGCEWGTLASCPAQWGLLGAERHRGFIGVVPGWLAPPGTPGPGTTCPAFPLFPSLVVIQDINHLMLALIPSSGSTSVGFSKCCCKMLKDAPCPLPVPFLLPAASTDTR